MSAAPCTPIPAEENPLSALLDAVTDAIVVVDRTWCITWANHVSERLLHVRPEAMVGEQLWDALPALERTPFAIACRRAMDVGATVSVEAFDPRRDAWFEARAFPSPQGLLISFRDVSDRIRINAERERLLESEGLARESAERAAERIAVLQSLTAKLSSALTPEEVVEVVVGAAMKAVGAAAATVALARDGKLHLAAYRGYDASIEGYATIDPGADLPLAKTFRTLDPEWISSIEQFIERYPAFEPEVRDTVLRGGTAVLPLRIRDTALGATALTFAEPQQFPPEDRSFLEAIAHQCALALDRALLFAREHEARARAEAGEQRFRAIFQSPMMGLMLTELDGLIVEANDAFLRMSGYERADLHRGMLDWKRLTAPESAEVSANAAADLRTRGYVAPFEKRYIRKDGTRLPVLVASTRIESQNLNATFVLDISERQRMLEEARASASRSSFLAEASRILAGSLDYKSTLDSISKLAVPTLADWCSVDMLTAEGKLERVAIMHPDPAKLAVAAEIARRFPPKPDSPHGITAVVRTGKPQWFRMISDVVLEQVAQNPEHLEMIKRLGLRSFISVPLLSRGVVLGALTLVYAESGRLYDDADFDLAQELARQASLAVDNSRLYAEAQEAIRLRDDFLSVASHELKTPLTPLQLRLQVLSREVKESADARIEQHMDVAYRQVRKLASLVDGLLDVSRISAGRLQLELDRFDLTALARDVVRGHEQEAARGGSVLEVRGSTAVEGTWDRLRLEQVLTNLVSNAIKYGAGRPIEVKVSAQGDEARIDVHDEGIGISEEDRVRIFERFERAVSGRNYGGLGLGLYITRRIVEAHGGTIRVESRPGDGSTFTVTLPLQPPSA